MKIIAKIALIVMSVTLGRPILLIAKDKPLVVDSLAVFPPSQPDTREVEKVMSEGLAVLMVASMFNRVICIAEDERGGKTYLCYGAIPQYASDEMIEGRKPDGRIVRSEGSIKMIFGKVEVPRKDIEPLLDALLKEFPKRKEYSRRVNITINGIVMFVEMSIDGKAVAAWLPLPAQLSDGESPIAVKARLAQLGESLYMLWKLAGFAEERVKVDMTEEVKRLLRSKRFRDILVELKASGSADSL